MSALVSCAVGFAAAPVITSGSTATGTVGKQLTFNVTATNTPTSYTASGLPDGLAINKGTGVVIGTPTIGGIFSSTVNAINADGTATATVIFTISGGTGVPVITTTASIVGLATKPMTIFLTATGLTPITFTATGLPAGLVLSGTQINGAATVSGTFPVTINASNATGAATAVTFSLLIGPASGAPIFLLPGGSKPTLNLALGDFVNYTIVLAGSPTPTVTVGTLPSGISATGAALSGQALVAGTFPVSLMASNSAGTDSTTLTITVTGTNAGGKIMIKDSYSQAVKKIDDGSGTKVPTVVSTSGFTISAKIDLTGLKATFDATTPYKIAVGEFTMQGLLGDSAPSFTANKSATFVQTIDPGNGKLVKVLTVKLSYSAKSLGVMIAAKDNDLQDTTSNIIVDTLLDQTGTLSAPIVAVISLGTNVAIFPVTLTGTAPKIANPNSDNPTVSAAVGGSGTASSGVSKGK